MEPAIFVFGVIAIALVVAFIGVTLSDDSSRDPW